MENPGYAEILVGHSPPDVPRNPDVPRYFMARRISAGGVILECDVEATPGLDQMPRGKSRGTGVKPDAIHRFAAVIADRNPREASVSE